MRATTLRKLFLPIAVATMAATACGGGGGDDAPAPPPPAPSPSPNVPPLGTATDITAGQQVGTAAWGGISTTNGGTGQTLEGVPCLALNETFHIHSHVAIAVDGVLVSVPANMGIVSSSPTAPGGCYYEVHTHDLSGKIHIEAPVPKAYTLGAVFAIWGQPLSTTNVAGVTGKPIEFFVTDGSTTTRYTGDPRAIELVSKRLITIQIGTPLAAIPNFTWSGN